MRYNLIFLIISLIVAAQSTLGQSKIRSQDEQQVMDIILDFNQIVFKEMNMPKAVETHLFLGQPDSVDRKYGLEVNLDTFFQDKTQNISREDKIKIIASEFNSSLNLPLLYWQMGTETISLDTKFIDSFIAENKDLEKIWHKVINNMGLSEDGIDELDELEDREVIENLSTNFNSAIAKKINKKLYNKNLVFINKNMKIKEENFEGRQYFEIENKLFHYTVAFKNNMPKIMRINRN